ncbi:hypothetical protein HUO09_16785 [Vibrio sp. Y2-5]|uniref:hypothetical protein n=1 Tax=Vibrio sp. Y2-5 TaxID=2743977 RepID=UPI0019C50E57|nr:hypothetical protein [Vibrio sp. Y2-5]MBD0788011.1 hypothetical protein [Vibrio sp. Y2-5]
MSELPVTYEVQIDTSTPQKVEVFKKAKELELLDGLAQLAKHFGKFDSCQIEVPQPSSDPKSNDVLRIVAGYKLMEVVITQFHSYPLVTRVSDKALFRLVPIINDQNQTIIHWIPDSPRNTVTFCFDVPYYQFPSSKRVIPTTGY